MEFQKYNHSSRLMQGCTLACVLAPIGLAHARCCCTFCFEREGLQWLLWCVALPASLALCV